MKIFKHKKQIDDTFDIVHLSGPKDNYNITESMGTLIYTASAVKPSPSGLGCRGKKSGCLIYYTIIILKISKFDDFH